MTRPTLRLAQLFAAFTPRGARTIVRLRLATKEKAVDAAGGHADAPKRQPLRHRIEAAGLRTASWAIPKLSRDVAMGVGRVLGRLGYLLLRYERRVACANLDIVFGDAMARREKRRIVRASFQNIGCNLAGL